VPVEFLSDAELSSYGRFDGSPSRRDLARFCLLDVADLARVGRRRGEVLQLGFALQLATLRTLGTFLANPLEVPWSVVEFLAGQLDVDDASCVKDYPQRLQTVCEHQWAIRSEYGWRDFADGLDELVGFLDARTETRQEPARVLFSAAVGWLRETKILLPGASVLARLVSERRHAAAEALYARLTSRAQEHDPGLAERLDGLLVVDEGRYVSGLERLRRGPDRVSSRQMRRALARVDELAAFGVGQLALGDVAPNRLEFLARDGLTSKAPLLRTRAPSRRTATLVATVWALHAAAVDDAVDLLNVLVATRLIRVAKRVSRDKQLSSIPKLSRAAARLARAMRVVVDVAVTGDSIETLMGRLEAEVGSPVELLAAADVIDETVPEDDDPDVGWRSELVRRFGIVRSFLEMFTASI
jgi:hypothetical protein